MAHIALAYHEGSDDECRVYNVIDNTATVIVPSGHVFEVAFQDLTRVVVHASAIDGFEYLVQRMGLDAAYDALLTLTGSNMWTDEVWLAWAHCYL